MVHRIIQYPLHVAVYITLGGKMAWADVPYVLLTVFGPKVVFGGLRNVPIYTMLWFFSSRAASIGPSLYRLICGKLQLY